MTTKIVLGACALAYACVVSGCYAESASCEDSETCPPPAYDAGPPDSGHAFDGGRKDASTIVEDAASTTSGDGTTTGASSGGGAGSGGSAGATCAPGAACGGLYACDDSCYGDDCCRLYCTCTDPTGQSGTEQCALECN